MLLDYMGDNPHTTGVCLRTHTVKQLDDIIALNDYDLNKWFDERDAEYKKSIADKEKLEHRRKMWASLNQDEKMLCHKLYMKSMETKCKEYTQHNEHVITKILRKEIDRRYATFYPTYNIILNDCWDNSSRPPSATNLKKKFP